MKIWQAVMLTTREKIIPMLLTSYYRATIFAMYFLVEDSTQVWFDLSGRVVNAQS